MNHDEHKGLDFRSGSCRLGKAANDFAERHQVSRHVLKLVMIDMSKIEQDVSQTSDLPARALGDGQVPNQLFWALAFEPSAMLDMTETAAL
jgi:hypothetical protein